MTLTYLYRSLFRSYGPQGWWPLVSRAGTGGRDASGYLPASYDKPDALGAFEISLGAILTQNTNWNNAAKAVRNLLGSGFSTPQKILSASPDQITGLIRSAGYYNGKTRKLFALSSFFRTLGEGNDAYPAPERDRLLDVWGIGPETADSILLYAFNLPFFVIDAYTRRILSRMGITSPDGSYEILRHFVEGKIPYSVPVYKEFHAVLVEHAKRYCKAKPSCPDCFLRRECGK